MKNKKVVTEVVREGNTSSLTTKPAKTWEITLNNPNEEDKLWLQNIEYNKCVIYEEIAPNTGTIHWQGQITFKRAYRLNALKKMHNKIHWEITKANADANYARKIDSKKIIDIDNTNQGKRTDLKKLNDEIKSGRTVRDIRQENPMIYHQYGRTLEKLEDDSYEKGKRYFKTKCIWIYGETGTGKSLYAWNVLLKDMDVYNWTDDKGWWDNYKGQEGVIFDDFRGEIPYNLLLKLSDRYPVEISRRGKAPLNFNSKLIVITSSLHPKDVYIEQKFQKDKIDQLIRRIDIIEMNKQLIANILDEYDDARVAKATEESVEDNIIVLDE